VSAVRAALHVWADFLMLKRSWVLLLVVLQVFVVAGSHAGGASPPMVAFVTERDAIRVAAADRTRLARAPLGRSFSLRGGLLAAEGGPGVVGYNARTGGRRFSIPAAAHPIVLDPRGRVAFWATEGRDEQVNSVWIRQTDGRIRRIVQISNGGDLPGYDTGYEGEAALLNMSFDTAGTKMAVALGNDVSLFIYDVYVVNVATGRVQRITNDRTSRWPSMAPDARRVAYQREVAECGPDYVRAARLVVERVDGTGEKILTSGSCEEWFSNPRWINDRELVAYRQRRTAARPFDVDLFLINATTGERRRLTTSRMVGYFTVDPSSGRIGFERIDTDGFYVIDLDGGRTRFRTGMFPHLAGEPGTH
jgi:hypothetical protein